MKQRLNYIDRMKGFAILLVVMGHLYFFSYDKSQSPVFEWISSFHMPLFMFLSGLVVSTPDIKKVAKQLRRFLVPMFVFGLIFTFTFNPVFSFENIIKVVRDLLMSESKNGYWYLMSLSVFYCSMLVFRLNKENKVWLDVVISGVLLLIYGLSWKFTERMNNLLCMLNCTSFFPFFISGYFVKKYNLLPTLTCSKWIWCVTGILYLILLNIEIPIHALASLTKRLIIPSLAIVTIVNLFVKREKCTSALENALSYLGKNTLDVYVLHYFIVANISLVAFDRWTLETNNIILSMVVTLVLSIPITYLSVWTGKILRKSTIGTMAFGEPLKNNK